MKPVKLSAAVRSPLFRSLVLLVLMAAAIWLLAPQALDLPRLAERARSASPWLLAAALVPQIARYVGGGLLMALCAHASGAHVSGLAASEAALASGAASRVLPFGGAGGMAVRLAFLKRAGMDDPAIAAYFLLQNVLGTASLLTLLAAAIAVGYGSDDSNGALTESPLPLFLGIALGIALIALFRRQPPWLSSLLAWMGRQADRLWARLTGRSTHLEESLPHAIPRMREALDLGRVARFGLAQGAFYSLWTILGDVLSLYLVGEAMGFAAGPAAAVLSYAAGSFAASVTGMPGGLGVTEGAMAAAYTALGYPADLALSIVLVFRALSFWLPIPVGLLAGWHLRRRGGL